MLKTRVIPILTFNGFGLVKSKEFAKNARMVGNAVQAAKVYNSRNVDELVFLDIYASDSKRKINLQMARLIINECFMPVAIGGGINSIKDIQDLLEIGADKVVIKSALIENPSFINEASLIFGNQCITLAIDAIQIDGKYFLYNRMGREIPMFDFLKNLSELNFGEIILTSVNGDGMMSGLDLELIKKVEELINVPIVVAGGVGTPEHVEDVFRNTNVSAIGAASIFHFTKYTPLDLKMAIKRAGKPVRLLSQKFTPIN